jgi:hypothetical protein
MSELIKKHLPILVIAAIGVITVIFIVYIMTLPMPQPFGY